MDKGSEWHEVGQEDSDNVEGFRGWTMGEAPEDPTIDLNRHLRRAAGLELRVDDAADRRGASRRLSESLDLGQLLVAHHVRNDRIRIRLVPDRTLEGVVVGVGSDALAIAAIPDGTRYDVPLGRVVAIESVRPLGGTRSRPDPDAISSLATRLRHLQALECELAVHTVADRTYRGAIEVVADDHLIVGGVTIALAHVVVVETATRRPRRWGISS